ncbi:MAG: DUF6291 domain-containing protein [Clostridiales bacterium]|nr:DUF6291 domain-containing protein [Clostridiales bacterium]
MAKESGLVVHHDWFQPVASLTDAQVGELFRAALDYNETGNRPSFTDPIVEVAFNFIKVDIDRDNGKRTK